MGSWLRKYNIYIAFALHSDFAVAIDRRAERHLSIQRLGRAMLKLSCLLARSRALHGEVTTCNTGSNAAAQACYEKEHSGKEIATQFRAPIIEPLERKAARQTLLGWHALETPYIYQFALASKCLVLGCECPLRCKASGTQKTCYIAECACSQEGTSVLTRQNQCHSTQDANHDASDSACRQTFGATTRPAWCHALNRRQDTSHTACCTSCSGGNRLQLTSSAYYCRLMLLTWTSSLCG